MLVVRLLKDLHHVLQRAVKGLIDPLHLLPEEKQLVMQGEEVEDALPLEFRFVGLDLLVVEAKQVLGKKGRGPEMSPLVRVLADVIADLHQESF